MHANSSSKIAYVKLIHLLEFHKISRPVSSVDCFIAQLNRTRTPAGIQWSIGRN